MYQKRIWVKTHIPIFPELKVHLYYVHSVNMNAHTDGAFY